MIQAQQAAIMRLESLEKQRMEAQENAGYHRLSAEEIIALLDDGPDRDALSKQMGDLKDTLEEIRYHNDRAMEIARANLQIINSLATGSDKKQGGHGVYKPKPTPGSWQATTPNPSSFEKKI